MKELISIYVSLFLIFSPLFGQAMSQKEYAKKQKWNVRLVGGDSYLNVVIWGFRGIEGDSLVVSDMGITKTTSLRSIEMISSTKVKSKAWKYAKIGIIIGIAIPLTAAVGVLINCDGFANCSDGGVSAAGPLLWFALVAPPFGLIGAGVGAGIGSAFKQERDYDMSDWTIEAKRAQIQKLMKK